MTHIYPVIHYKDDQTTIEQAVIAHSLGADGIFLISHIGGNEKLIGLGVEIKKMFNTFKVGINFLGDTVLNTANAAKNNHLDMIWADVCGVSSSGLDKEGEQLVQWKKNNPEIEVFASVAFKYQRFESNPPKAAQEALNAGFIPTTSGSGTGSAPLPSKIIGMSEATNGILAIASGMTCDNVKDFYPHLSHILVATGISKDDYHFDIDKLASFINIVKNKK